MHGAQMQVCAKLATTPAHFSHTAVQTAETFVFKKKTVFF